MQRIIRRLKDESGTTAVEYAVMLALIAALCIAALRSAGTTVSSSLNNSSNQIGSAMSGS